MHDNYQHMTMQFQSLAYNKSPQMHPLHKASYNYYTVTLHEYNPKAVCLLH